MKKSNLLKRLKAENERKPKTHEIGSGLKDQELARWKKANPRIKLPADYLSFLRQANGLRIRPDKDTPTGVVRLLPLREVKHAPEFMYGDRDDSSDGFPESWIVITEDPDSSCYVILDTKTGRYAEYDPITYYENAQKEFDGAVIGRGIESLLSWLSGFVKAQ